MSNKKVVETNKMPDGRFIYQIGEVDSMGGGFGMFFEDSASGSVKYFDTDGKVVFNRKRAVEIVYEGEFFDTREEARASGRAAVWKLSAA